MPLDANLPANTKLNLLTLLNPRRREMARNLEFQKRDPQNFGTGATNFDLAEAQDDLTPDPNDAARLNDTENQLHDAAVFNQPDVAGMRNEKEANALRRLLLPVQARAEADAAQREHTFDETLMRDRLNNQDVVDRQAAVASAAGARTAMTQNGQSQRQILADKLMRARTAEAQAGKVSAFSNFFTGNRDRLMKEATTLRSDLGGMDQAQQDAILISQQYPGRTFEDLLNSGEISFDTPEEMQAAAAAFNALQQEQ